MPICIHFKKIYAVSLSPCSAKKRMKRISIKAYNWEQDKLKRNT